MNSQRNSEAGCQNKELHGEANSTKHGPSNVIPVNRKRHAAFSNDIITSKLDAGEKLAQAEAVVSLQGTSKLGFIILGFVFGLLISIAVLILYKLDNIVSPVAANNDIAGRMNEIENNFAYKLQLIQQQREADLKKYRSLTQEKESSLARTAALQRDRDAALAIAKARAELLQAKLEVRRGSRTARGATEKASIESARAAARLKFRLSQQQKTEAVQSPVDVSKAATIEARSGVSFVEGSAAKAVPTISALLDQKKQSGVDKQATGFQSNPCNGPTAVLLSTCKKQGSD